MIAAAAKATVITWSDQEIQITVPAITTSGTINTQPQTVTVTRGDGAGSCTALAFVVK